MHCLHKLKLQTQVLVLKQKLFFNIKNYSKILQTSVEQKLVILITFFL